MRPVSYLRGLMGQRLILSLFARYKKPMGFPTSLVAALCLAALPALAQEWHVGPAPSDDPAMPAATIRNDDGAALYLWSLHTDDRYQVFAEIHLPAGQSFGDDMPVYRIDDGAEIDTDQIRHEGDDVGAIWGYVGHTAALWLVWTSIQDTVLPSDRLHDWFTGQELAIDYIDAGGVARTASFVLTGSEYAILAATNLKAE